MNRHRTSDTVALTIKKLYLYGALLLFVGFVSGVATTTIVRGPVPVVPEWAQGAIPQTADPSADPNIRQPNRRIEVATAGRPARGPEDALVTMVEFTDYQCIFCAQYFRLTYPQLLIKYEGRLRYVSRHFPIGTVHSRAAKAAEAAECAYDQGKFWEYHDILFERQTTPGVGSLFEHRTALDVESLKNYAVELGLDVETFNQCLDSGEKTEIIRQDIQDGRRYGLRGTPTFFVNGRMLPGALPLATFESFIDAALREADHGEPTGSGGS